MNDYETYEPLAHLLQPLIWPIAGIIVVVYVLLLGRKLIHTGLFMKVPKVNKRTRDMIRINKAYVEEWMLASDEELATLGWKELRKLLDSRNPYCDKIIELAVQLEEPIYRDNERRKKIEAKIRELRLAPLRELEKQADIREQEILQDTGY